MKKPVKLTPPVKKMGNELYFEVSAITIHEEREPVAYGSWREEKSCSLKNVSRNKDLLNKWNFHSYIVPDEVYNASNIYVVVVTYSSGDSFGRSEGNIALAFATENPEEAIAAKKAIEDEQDFDSRWSDNKPNKEDIWSVKFDKHPKRLETSNYVWGGYFERVESVNIEFKTIMG